MYRCENCFNEYSDEYDICPHCGYVKNSGKREVYMLPIGTMLNNRYYIGKMLGNGGFGNTYKAWDMTLQRCVAVKEHYPCQLVTRTPGTKDVIIYATKKMDVYEAEKRRFLDEAKYTREFNADASKRNNNIVDVTDCFEENNTAYFVMEFLDGVPLNKYLKEKGGKLSVEEATDIIMKIANALRSVHEKGYVHRDISPDNIFVCKNNVIKLIDFGAARFTRNENVQLSIILKPGYAPPEQYESVNEQGPWTDIYALGATLYHLLVGEKPEESTNRKIRDEVLPPHEIIPEISENLSNTVMRAMAIDRHLRFNSVKEFSDAIKISIEESGKKGSKKKVLSPGDWHKRRKRIRNISIAVSTLIVIAAFSIFAFRLEKQREEETLPTATIEVWCMELKDNTDGTMSDKLDSIAGQFRTSYENVTINITTLPEEEYLDTIMQAINSGEAPDLFLSSGLNASYLENATELTKLAQDYYKENCLFYSQYVKNYPDKKQIPLGFTYPVVFVNTGMLECEKNTVKNISALLGSMDYNSSVTENAESFYASQFPMFYGSTADYFDVQSYLSGSYVMVVISDQNFPEKGKGNFCYEWSIMAGDKDEEKVAMEFLEYLLTEYSQDIMLLQTRQNILPINRRIMAAYADSFGEYMALYNQIK